MSQAQNTSATTTNIYTRLVGVKTPENLLEDALQTFTAAEKKLETAVNEIARQEAALIAQRTAVDDKITAAVSVKERLVRIQQRVMLLLA